MPDLVEALRAAGLQDVEADAPGGPFTTLRVGGPFRALVTVEEIRDLERVDAVVTATGVPTVVVGRGSNLLVDDNGFDGVAIRLGRGFRDLTIEGSGLVAGAAAPLPTVARLAADAGQSGLAWMAAVPGSIGGAVRMNAGAHGGEVADVLTSAMVHTLGDGVRSWTLSEFAFAYRRSAITARDIVVDATFELTPGDADELRAEMDEIRQWRREHQPLNEPNCGSVFTNPPGDSAGRLIEDAGCKSLSVGGATVSQRHANFIVTRPGATASDVSRLIEQVVGRVADVHGITLHTEVVRVGPGTS